MSKQLNTDNQSKSVSNNEACLEVAVFSTENISNELQLQANEVFCKYPGFIKSLALVSTEDANLRADLVIWASLKEALDAAENFKNDPNLSTYASSIKKLDVFGHYKIAKAGLFGKLADAPIVELIGYKTLPKAVVESRQKVHEALAGIKEAAESISVNTITDAFEQSGITPEAIDIIGWSTTEANRYKDKPQPLLFRHPMLKPFFQYQSENIAISKTFRRVYDIKLMITSVPPDLMPSANTAANHDAKAATLTPPLSEKLMATSGGKDAEQPFTNKAGNVSGASFPLTSHSAQKSSNPKSGSQLPDITPSATAMSGISALKK